MKKFMLAALIFVMVLGCLSSCDKDKTDSSSSVSPWNTASNNTGTASYEVVDPVALGDTLTSAIEGDWIVTSIYQTAKVSDQTEAEALSKEQSKAVHLGSDFFESYSARLDVPYYKIRNATQQDLQTEGFSLTNIQKDFNGTIECIDVFEEDGKTHCITFYIKGENLVFIGAGGYIFSCTKTQAVG